MSEVNVRAGWTRVTLGDVITRAIDRRATPVVDGLTRYVGVDDLDPDELKLRRWGEVSDGELPPTFRYVFAAGSVLFPTRRPSLRKCAVAPFAGITGEKVLVLQSLDASRLNPGFMPFLLTSEEIRRWVVDRAIGSVTPHFRWRDLASYEFLLPPLEEQGRMAEALSAVDTLIGALLQLRQSLYVAELGMLENVMSHVGGALVTVDSLLREPPRNGLSPSANADEAGLRTVSISAVRNGRFDPAGCIKHAMLDLEVAAPFFIERGDTFVIRGNGNRQTCGKAGLSETSYDDLFYPDLLIRLRFDIDRILPEFAVAQWNLPSVHMRLSARAKSSNGIWKVNGEDIRTHRLLAPPIRVQQAILEGLAAMRSGVQAAQAREKSLRQFKAAILRRACGQS